MIDPAAARAHLDAIKAHTLALEAMLAAETIDPDRALLAALVDAYDVGGTFRAREVVETARLGGEVAAKLPNIIASIGGSALRLGRWLARLEGTEIGGFRLERLAVEHNAAVWAVRVVCR